MVLPVTGNHSLNEELFSVLNPVAQAGQDTTVCTSSLELYANTPGINETGFWSIPSPLSVSSENNPSATLSGMVEGNIYTLTWTVIDDEGNESSDDITISYQNTSQPNAGEDQCIVLPHDEETVEIRLEGSAPLSNENLKWKVASSNSATEGSIVAPASSITDIKGLLPGSHEFELTFENQFSKCTATDEVKITVIQEAKISEASLCLAINSQDTTINLNGTAPSGSEIVSWHMNSSSPAIINNPTTSVTSIYNLAKGNHLLSFKIENSGCKDSANAKISVVTKSQAGLDTCLSNTDTLILNSNLTEGFESGNWTATSGTFKNSLNRNTSYYDFSIGKSNLLWTIKDSTKSCISSDSIWVTGITPPIAGDDTCIVLQEASQTTTFSLRGHPYNPEKETAEWISISGDSSIGFGQNISVNLSAEKHVFCYLIRNNSNGCTLKDTVNVTVITKAIAGPDQCLTEPVSSVFLDASAPKATSGETGVWKANYPLNISSLSNPAAEIENPPSGAFNLFWIIENQGCKDSSATKFSIISKANVMEDTCIVYTGPDGKIFLNSAPINTLYQSGLWFTESTSRTFTRTYTSDTEISNLSKGVNKIYYKITDTINYCSSMDSLSLTTLTEPEAGQNQCHPVSTGSKEVTLSSNGFGVNEEGFWTNKDSASVKFSIDPTTSLVLPIGKHTFYWNIENKISGCLKRDSVIVTLISKPLAGPDQCLTEPVSQIFLNANKYREHVGETGSWGNQYELNFSDIKDSSAIISNPPSGGYHLRWIIENDGCRDSSTVQVSIISKAKTGTGSCYPYDGPSESYNLSAAGINTAFQKGIWSLQEGAGSIETPTLNVTKVTNLAAGLNKFYWTINDTIEFCSSTDSITITTVTQAEAGEDQCIITSNDAEVVTFTGNNYLEQESGFWTNKDSSSVVYSNSVQKTTLLPIGRHTFYWNIKNKVSECSTKDSVVITILPKANAGAPQCLQEPVNEIYLNAKPANDANGEEGYWSFTSGLPLNSPSSPNTTISSPPSGSYRLRWVVENKGCKDSSETKVSIISKPEAGPGDCILENGDNTIAKLEAENYNRQYQTAVWKSENPLVTFSDNDSTKTTVSNLVKGVNRFYWSISDTIGFCSFKDSVDITVLSVPVAETTPCSYIDSGFTKTLHLKGSSFNAAFEYGKWSSNKSVLIPDSGKTTAMAVTLPGVYNFYWTIFNKESGCFKSDTIEAVVTSGAKIRNSNENVICVTGKDTPVTLSADSLWSLKGESGRWYEKLYPSSTPLTITNSNRSVSEAKDLSIGIHKIIWEIENHGCISKDSIRLSVISPADAAPSYCTPFSEENNIINLKASPIQDSAEEGIWALSSQSNSYLTVRIDSAGNSNTSATGLAKGIHKFYWTVSDTLGLCSSVDSLTASVITAPDAGYDICKTIPLESTHLPVALKGNSPEIGSEEGVWSSPSPIEISNKTNSNSSSLLSQGVYKAVWSIQNKESSFCKLSDTVSVRIISEASAGEDQCLVTPTISTILQGNPVFDNVGESGVWYNITDSLVTKFENRNSPNAKITNLKTGVHKLKWVINNDGCKDSAFVNVSLVTKPKVSQNHCLAATGSNTSVTLIGNKTTPGDFPSWTPSANSVSGLSLVPNKDTCKLSIFYNGSYTIYYTIKDTTGYCPVKDSAVVTVLTQPVVPPSMCEIISLGSTTKDIKFQGNKIVENKESGTWTSSPNIDLSDLHSSETLGKNIPAGKYNLFWTVKNLRDTSCYLTDTTTLRLINKSLAGPDTCIIKPDENTLLNANFPLKNRGEQGYWKLLSESDQIQFDPNNPKSTVIRLPVGITTFRWFIKNETCIDSSDVQISVQTKADAGNNLAVCGPEAEIKGNRYGLYEKGAWQTVSNLTSKIKDSTANETVVENLTPGPNKFLWTISNRICKNSDTVTVTNNQPTEVYITTEDSQQTCFTTNHLQGNNPSTEIITSKSLWKVISEPEGNSPKAAFINPGSFDTHAKNMNAPGDYKFLYQIFNSTCDTISDTISMTRDASINNSASGPGEACINETIQLTGVAVPDNGEGVWRLGDGAGFFTDKNSNVTYVNDIAINQNIFYWELSRGECKNIFQVSVKGYAPPSKAEILSKDQVFCETDTVTLKAVAPSIGTGKWELLSGNGQIEEPDKAITKVSNLGYGENIFRWICFNGPCDTSFATVKIKRDQEVTNANAGEDSQFCGNRITLSADPVSVGSGRWSILEGEADIIAPDQHNSIVLNIKYGKTVFLWEIKNGVCSSRDTFVLTTSPKVDSAKAGKDIEVCQADSVVLKANTPTVGKGVWISSGTAEISNLNSHSTSVKNIPKGISSYIWMVKKEFCESSDTVDIINYFNPTTADAGADAEIFDPNHSLNATPVQDGTGEWTPLSDQVFVADKHSEQTNVSGIPFGETKYVWTVTNGTCPVSRDTVTLFRNEFTIPNAFSPNGDAKNNTFEIKGVEQLSPVEFIVFNRWGEQVYHSKHYNNDWDGKNNFGKDLVDDTYYYVLKTNNGLSYQGYIVLKR